MSVFCKLFGHRWRHWAGDRWLIGWAVCAHCDERKFFPETKNPQKASNWTWEDK